MQAAKSEYCLSQGKGKTRDMCARKHSYKRCTVVEYWLDCTHPSQFVVSDGAGVHEGLGDDRQHSVHVVRVLHIEDKLRVLEDVDPEAQR